MAKKKISDLPAGGALNGTELVPIVQTGTTKRITAQDIANLGNASGVEGSGTINYLAKFSATSTIGNSLLFDNGTSIGLGTATPSATYKLDIIGGIRATTIVKSGGTSAEYLKADGSVSTLTNPITGTGTTNYLPKFTGASALGNSSIFDNGNVGIGTTSPARKLSISTTANGIPLRLETDGSNTGIELIGGNTLYNFFVGKQYNVSNAFEITPSTAAGGTTFSTPALVVTSGGNVGIGTTSPSYKFQTSASVNSDWVGSFYNTSTTTPNGLQVRVGVSSTAQALGVYTDGIGYTFNVLGNGNVLIGTTTDGGFKLDVNGTARVSGELLISTPDDSGMRIKAGATRLSYIDFADANTGAPSGSISYNHTSDYFVISVGGSNAEKMRVNSNTINITSIPTSSAGLSAGDIWSHNGTLKIV